MKTLVKHHPAYVELVEAVMKANDFDISAAECVIEDAMADIHNGEASYASAAMNLNLHVNLAGQCGFDAADLLSMIY